MRARRLRGGRNPEVLRHAADQETRLAPGRLQQIGQYRGGGGLAVGAGDRDHVAAGQHAFRQPVRARGVFQSGIEHVLDRRVAARERVADHDLVAVGGDVAGLVALAQRDAQSFQLRRHRRVHRLVAAFDDVPEFTRQRRDAAHEGAGNPKNMDLQRNLMLQGYRSVFEVEPVRHRLPVSPRKRSTG